MLGKLDLNQSIDVTLNIEKLLEGRLLIQGASGAGKSWTLRRLLEQSAGRIQQLVIDPEGEFKSLADELGYLYIEGHKLKGAALAEMARRARANRISMVVDLSDARREEQMMAVAAIFHALVECPQEMWHPALVAVDEAHLFAPWGTQGQESSAVRKASIAAVVDLMSRGRKRGLAGVLATQRLARLSKSVVSEIHNFLIGINTLDLDVKRAAETIGWEMRKAYDRLPMLTPGEFVATGPAFSLSAVEVRIGAVKSRHVGASPQLAEVQQFDADAARSMLDLDELVQMSQSDEHEAALQPGFKAVRTFIRDESFPLAGRVFEALKGLMPDGTTVRSLAGHLKVDEDDLIAALALLESYGAVEINDEGVLVAPKFFWEKRQ
ncbi:ATP-binding protein [Tundrisphaera lichenicola]|uniref:ATP-binding protein n=1 Tax=Tundrisphaera lichenicola TaxID=2029860 RepID=UPI003EB7E684